MNDNISNITEIYFTKAILIEWGLGLPTDNGYLKFNENQKDISIKRQGEVFSLKSARMLMGARMIEPGGMLR